MLQTAELLKKVRKLEIVTTRLVDDVIGGAYHSVFKGRGIEFDEVREYTFEDDVRDIDWNVSARLNAPYVKNICGRTRAFSSFTGRCIRFYDLRRRRKQSL